MSVSQDTPFSQGIIGLAVSNPSYAGHIVRLTANPRRAVVTGHAHVELTALVTNIGHYPIEITAEFSAVSPDGRRFGAGQQSATIQVGDGAELYSSVDLAPLGDYNVEVFVRYSEDRGATWVNNPNGGMTDVKIFPQDNTSPEWQSSEILSSNRGAIIDYRDYPSEAWWPH